MKMPNLANFIMGLQDKVKCSYSRCVVYVFCAKSPAL